LNIWLRGALACVLTTCVAAQSDLAPRKRAFADLSAADRVEIQQLVARYAHALERGPSDGRAYAELFTPEGSLINSTETIIGRARLVAFAAKHATSSDATQTLSTNVLLEATPGGASGKVYAVTIRPDSSRGRGSIVAGGHFEDRYVRTAQGWRFERRQFFPSRLRQ
jgi:hypothetical protein